MLLRELTQYDDIPLEFLKCLPEGCPRCGGELEISSSLTGLRCADLRCLDKLANRLVEIMDKLGVVGVGVSNARKFFECYDLTNPMMVFAIVEEDLPFYEGCPESLDREVHKGLAKALGRKWSLGEYVQLNTLPHLQTTCSVLFEGYSDMESFYDGLSVNWIQDRLGIKADVSLKAMNIYKVLMEFKDELIEEQDRFDIIGENTQVIRVCISESAGSPFISKRDFMDKMTSLGDSLGVKVEFLPSLTRQCNVLVYAGLRVTNKLKKAESWGIPVMTGIEFQDELMMGV